MEVKGVERRKHDLRNRRYREIKVGPEDKNNGNYSLSIEHKKYKLSFVNL